MRCYYHVLKTQYYNLDLYYKIIYVTTEIENFNKREDVQAYIEDLKLKKDDLLELGKLVNANISRKDTKTKITEKIVDATVGARLRVEAISQIDLSRKK